MYSVILTLKIKALKVSITHIFNYFAVASSKSLVSHALWKEVLEG